MIEKIYGIGTVGNNTNKDNNSHKTFKGAEYRVTSPINCPNGICGIDALGTYNKILVSTEKALNIEPLKPINATPSSIEGEKIYASNGRLHSIVQNNDETSTVYTVDKNNPDKIVNIITTDSKTGNKIFEQSIDTEDDKEITYIHEFDKRTGQEIRYTRYENGEFDYTSSTTYKPNGAEVRVNKNKNDEYWVSGRIERANAYSCIDFDKNKQITNIYQDREFGNVRTHSSVEFYNGFPVSIHHSKDITIPNTAGREVLNDAELKPAEKFSFDIDYKSHEGNKTYYSNGTIESNEVETPNGKVIAYFNPNGEFNKVIADNKEIELLGKNNQKITENLGNNIKRTTFYSDKGECHITYETSDVIKNLDISQDGLPQSYSIRPVDENNKDIPSKTFEFNKDGMLESAWQC